MKFSWQHIEAMFPEIALGSSSSYVTMHHLTASFGRNVNVYHNAKHSISHATRVCNNDSTTNSSCNQYLGHTPLGHNEKSPQSHNHSHDT